ncbi:MAG: alpha/beta hydrolase [Bacteroidota bacterium]
MIAYFQGNPLHYKDEGTGRALVLLHGFPESISIWEDFTRTLTRHFRVIRIDLPGHGQSSLLGDVHTMELMAEAVKTVLDHANVIDCVMIGHSMGGYVTLSFAEKYPALLRGFGLFHSQAQAETEEGKTNRDRTIALIKENRQNFLHHFIPNLFAEQNKLTFADSIADLQAQAEKVKPESQVAAMEGMKQRKDHTHTLEKSKVPVLFIIGKLDSRMPYENIMKQAALPGHAEILVLGDTAHMGFIESPDITLRTIKDFAEKCFLYGE